MNHRVDNYIETFSGVKFDFLEPKQEQILIEDIAHSLSMQCRYTGHTSQFYSVAEHSLLVADLCPDKYKLYGLLHDATEAYLTDIASPIKPFLQNYKKLESKLHSSVCAKFNLPSHFPEEVCKADMIALQIEIKNLMRSGGVGWAIHNVMPDPVPDTILECMCPKDAKMKFLNRYHELTNNES